MGIYNKYLPYLFIIFLPYFLYLICCNFRIYYISHNARVIRNEKVLLHTKVVRVIETVLLNIIICAIPNLQ